MKALLIILLVLATGCHAQDTNGITSKVFERDSDKDGKPELRVETVYRDGTKVMLIWSKPDAQGVLRVSSRSYFAGGDMVSTESDEDRDGLFETIAVYRAGTSGQRPPTWRAGVGTTTISRTWKPGDDEPNPAGGAPPSQAD